MRKIAARLVFAVLLVVCIHAPVWAQGATVRYYLSKILAPSVELDKDYYRVALDDVIPRPNFSAVIPNKPDGTPAFAWGLAYATATDWSGVDADTVNNIRIFGGAEGNPQDIGTLLDTLSTKRWGDAGVSDTQRSRMRNACIMLGISTTDLTSPVSLRYVLQKFGRFLNPEFNELKLWVH